MKLFGHSFEFVDLDSERQLLGGVSVHDYQVIVDESTNFSRAELLEMWPELAGIADAAAALAHEDKENRMLALAFQ